MPDNIEKKRDEKIVDFFKYLEEAPPMEKKDVDRISAHQKKLMDESARGVPRCVAFSVVNGEHYSGGQQLPIDFTPLNNNPAQIIINEGNGWDGTNTFVVPCEGVYYISVDFVKDTSRPTYNTQDDVFIKIAVNNQFIAFAWSGEMIPSQPYDRSTGAGHVIKRLKLQDRVNLWVWSDGMRNRCLRNINFSVHKICQ